MSEIIDYVAHEGLADSKRLREAAPKLYNALVTLSAVMACDSDREARETAKQLGIESDGSFSELWQEIAAIIDDVRERKSGDGSRSELWGLDVR